MISLGKFIKTLRTDIKHPEQRQFTVELFCKSCDMPVYLADTTVDNWLKEKSHRYEGFFNDAGFNDSNFIGHLQRIKPTNWKTTREAFRKLGIKYDDINFDYEDDDMFLANVMFLFKKIVCVKETDSFLHIKINQIDKYIKNLNNDFVTNSDFAQLLRLLADLELTKGRLIDAVEFYDKAEEILRDNNGSCNAAYAIAYIQRGLADFELYSNIWDNVLKRFMGIDKLCEKKENTHEFVRLLVSIGKLAHRLKKIDKAKNYYEEAMHMSSQMRFNRPLADSLKALGDLRFEAGFLDEAHSFYKEARALYLVENNKRGLAYLCQAIFRLESKQNNFSGAKEMFYETIKWSKQDDNDNTAVKILRNNVNNIIDCHNEEFLNIKENIELLDELFEKCKEKNMIPEIIKIKSILSYLYTSYNAEKSQKYITETRILLGNLKLSYDDYNRVIENVEKAERVLKEQDF